MNEKLKEFLVAKKEAEKKKNEEEKQKTLIDLGLYEKIYSPNNSYSEEFDSFEWDSASETNKYYKKVAIEISDEEYQEVKDYSKNEETFEVNPVAKALMGIAWMIFICGLIAGIAFANVEVVKGTYYQYTDTEFSFAIAFTYWCVAFISGTIFLGFAEIIKLLDAIKKKL